jgi:hypothetical protein
MLLQIHLPLAFGTWSGTPNSSQHSPSAIWSARASWLECLPGIASILQHLSCGLSDSSVLGDVSSLCVMELAVTPHGSHAGVCCQECVAKASELDTRASWDWEDSDLCSNCVSSGKAGPGSGNHWNPCSRLFHWYLSLFGLSLQPYLAIALADLGKQWTGFGLCSKQCCSGPACWKDKCCRSEGMLLL